MASKNPRRTAPAPVVTETPPAVRATAAVADVKLSYFSQPLLHESFGGSIEWTLPDPSKPDVASLSAELWRGTGDSTEDAVSQTVPCYQVRLALHVGGPVGNPADAQFGEFAVPMHGGLKALAQLFLELYARTERMNLAPMGWDRDDDWSSTDAQPAEA